MKSKIFICHRHDEKKIAEVVNEHIQDWGINKKNIFISSNFESGGRIGSELNKELVTELTESNLLIFLYTHPIHDWSYCMWECGVATTLERATKIIVFECAKEPPQVFDKDIRVKANKKDDIKKFTFQFHKDDNFFPGLPAFNTELTDKILNKRANRFYEALADVIPGGGYVETPLLLMIKLALGSEQVNRFNEYEKPDAAYDYLHDHLEIEEASSDCPKHFGRRTIIQNMHWSELVESWRDDAKPLKYSDAWINDIYDEILKGLRNKKALPGGNILYSVSSDARKREYIPLVCLMREYPDGRTVFTVYLYRKTK